MHKTMSSFKRKKVVSVYVILQKNIYAQIFIFSIRMYILGVQNCTMAQNVLFYLDSKYL